MDILVVRNARRGNRSSMTNHNKRLRIKSRYELSLVFNV